MVLATTHVGCGKVKDIDTSEISFVKETPNVENPEEPIVTEIPALKIDLSLLGKYEEYSYERVHYKEVEDRFKVTFIEDIFNAPLGTSTAWKCMWAVDAYNLISCSPDQIQNV